MKSEVQTRPVASSRHCVWISNGLLGEPARVVRSTLKVSARKRLPPEALMVRSPGVPNQPLLTTAGEDEIAPFQTLKVGG